MYESYVWRVQHDASGADIELPHDLQWSDKYSWTPSKNVVRPGLDGSLFIDTSRFEFGRPITLVAPPSMAWVKMSVCDALHDLTLLDNAVLRLSFVQKVSNNTYGVEAFAFFVTFNYSGGQAIDVSPVKGYDGLEPDTWAEVKAFRFITVPEKVFSACSNNKVLHISSVSGTFVVGEVITGGTSGATGKLVSVGSTALGVYVYTGEFQASENVTGGTSNATATIDSIS